MPKILETDIGEIEFPDDFTVDQLNEWGRTQLPNLRERIQKGTIADLAARVPRDVVSTGADNLMAAARLKQLPMLHRDASVTSNLRSLGVAAAMSAPVGQEHAVISAANQVADTTEVQQKAVRDQQLLEDPLYKFGAELKRNAITQDQTNPALEQSIPAAISRIAPKMVEAAALETVAAPVAAVAAPAMMATKVGRMVPAMLSAGTAFGIGDEGKFSPTEAAIAAGTVPAFGAGEALATKILERLPIKSVNLDIPDVLKFSGTIDKAEEAMALGRRIQGAPEGFAAQVEQKLAGIPIGETGRKLIEQTGGVLAANAYLAAVQLPEILALPEDRRSAAIGDFLATNAAMSLLGYLPLIGGEPRPRPEIIKRVGEKLKEELTTKYGEPPPAPAAGLPEPPPAPRGPAAAPSEFAAPVQPTPEELAAEQAAAAADIARRENQPEPPPAPSAPQPAPKRRAIVPAEQPPRFRPPMPTPVTPVPETVTPVTPPAPPLPGPPEATTPVVPEAQQKGVATVAPVSYEDAQKRIDAIENQLAAQGVNVFHLYDPNDPGNKALRGHEDWKPMPPELTAAYSARDKIGGAQMDQSVSELRDRLSGLGLTEGETKRVLDYYGIDPTDRSAISQNHATEFAPRIARRSPLQQSEAVAIALAVEKGEHIDELRDVSKPTLTKAAQVVQSMREYFGISPQPTETPNAIPVGSTTPVPLGQGAKAGEEVGARVRNAEKPAVPQSEAQTPQAQGNIAPALRKDAARLKAIADEIQSLDLHRKQAENKRGEAIRRSGVAGIAEKEFHQDAAAIRKAKDKLLKERDKILSRRPELGTTKTDTPTQVEREAQSKVQEVAQGQGQRAAKEIKSELVSRLEEASANAKPASDFRETSFTKVSGERVVTPATDPGKVTIEIPGDGTFTIVNTKEAIEEVLKRARKLETSLKYKQPKIVVPEKTVTEYNTGKPAKLSVQLSEPPASVAISPEDIQQAFPPEQGYSVKPVAISWVGETPSTGYLVQLPNGELVLIDPGKDKIGFDPEKAAADWGLDPETVAREGVATGKWIAGGAKVSGLGTASLLELLKTSGPDTLSHEKFHALFQLALTDAERKAILDRYETEEQAAEAFRRSEGFTRGFWEKMRQFLSWLLNLFRRDVFSPLAKPARTVRAERTGGGEPKYSLETEMRNPRQFEERLAKPITSPEEAVSLKRQAGAGAGLVPDEIAGEIRALNPADPIEKRVASELDFVLKLHGVAPAMELQRIIADPNIPEDTKQAAISNVLRQIEYVRERTETLQEQLQEADTRLAGIVKNGERITAKKLVADQAKTIADNLISRYRQYLTAQAASLPANQNVAAARSELIRGMLARLDRNQTQSPDAMAIALNKIAENIGELPVKDGPQSVIDAIRNKGILKDAVGDSTIDLLTAEQMGGLPPLLASPEAGAMFQGLADLQKKSATYAKQIEVIEQAFRGKGPPTPVEVKKFADAYRKFRNKQVEAAKIIAEHDKDFAKADEDAQVYGRSYETLTRLQQDPQFQSQLETALNRPGGEVLSNIYRTGKAKEGEPVHETVFVSPLKQQDAEGKEVPPNEYRIKLAPNRAADNATLEQMRNLIDEIDRFLDGENGPVDPLERRTWEQKRDYIAQYVQRPQFLLEDAGSKWANPFEYGQLLLGNLATAMRPELASIGLRAAEEANKDARVADQAGIGYKLIANNKEFGDAANDVAVIKAVESHNWPLSRIEHWNQYVLNPIIAAGQTAGQMRLKSGDYIPGTTIRITPEDMRVATMEKRFSSGIVRTTQGTAQGSAGILRNNPILISDKVIGKPVLRGALSPGPFTMARSFSQWGRGFSKLWSEATPERRRQMVDSGPDFDMAARGFVTTTNPEFDNKSPLVQVYEAFTAKAKDNPDYAVNSFDQLVDKLATIAVEKGLYPSEAEAKPQIETTLMNDIGNHVSAIQAQYAEDKINPDVPQTVAQFASAQNAFTKARKTMVAPDPYYDYTLTHDSDRINFVGAGYQLFQMRIISSLEALLEALDNQQIRWDKEIADLYANGKMTKEQAQSAVQKRTAKEIGEQRFSYEQLLEHKQRIDKMIKQMNELVIDVRNPNDSNLLKALTRFHGLLSSGLLSNPTAIGNNLAGGLFAAKAVTLRNIGMGNQFYSPRGHAYLVKATVSKLLRAFPGNTAIGKVARSNMPVVSDLAGWVHDMLADQIELERASEAAGLIATADLKNRSIARGKLPTTAGQIDYSKPSKAGKVVNALGSIPYLRGSLAHLREKIPGMFDRFMNTNNARFYQNTVFRSLQSRAIRAFKTREEIAARTGVSLDEMNDFTREANQLSAKELKMPKYSGIRDSGRLRQLFSSIGSLDAFLLDYYNRWKAAPEAEKANVPLFPDQADEFEVIHELESHENIATSGYTPLSMQGVGQRGLWKKFLFMFKNYPTRMFTQMSRLLATDPRDPKGRKLMAWWAVLSVLIVSAIAGILSREVSGPIQQAITGRSPSAIKLANVLENPDAAMIMRYVGMGLAGNLPYYGQVISQILGNPGYGSVLDIADYIPGLGLIKDAGKTISRISQTGDAVFPLVDFASRWFPPSAPLTRLLPGVEGDIEAKNAARALRVVGPSAGIELAGGGGAPSTQSPASASIRRLMSAAFQGDQAGIQKAFEEAVAEKRAQGSADPERAVLQAIAAREPARQVAGRAITPAEEAQAVALMSPGQRASYANAQNAFSLINSTLGTKYSLTSTPRARMPGQPTRRSLTGSSVPSFARGNRFRIRGRRRPFGHLSIRGASQRKSKRRSPARFSFAA